MGHTNFSVGCVGKPSVGKSTFFNAVTDGKAAKVGAYPFTTIESNQGIAYYGTECPCQKYRVHCKPRYGQCINGKRTIPIKLLDVAGLIPGASEGLGLGNKFLDDLRHADVLLHILDISGTTNEKGELTTGYDPSKDHEWLIHEIELWIFNNLWNRWGNIARKHQATQSTPVVTLLGQLSGYGAKELLIQQTLEDVGITTQCCDFLSWDKEKVVELVSAFVKRRFQFILVLNKADVGGDADKNAINIANKFDGSRVVLASALTECFLKKMRQQGFIDYIDGSIIFSTAEDTTQSDLKQADEKIKNRLEKVKDMVLYRLGSTGVHEAIQKAVEVAGLIPVYPVRSWQHFGKESGAFPEAELIRPGTTVRQFAKILHAEIYRHYLYAEGPDGCRLGDDDIITTENNIIRYVTNLS